MLTKLFRKFPEKSDFRKTGLPVNSRKCFQKTRLIFNEFFSTKKLSILLNHNLTLKKKNKEKVLILSIVSIFGSKSIDGIDTKFFWYFPSLIEICRVWSQEQHKKFCPTSCAKSFIGSFVPRIFFLLRFY